MKVQEGWERGVMEREEREKSQQLRRRRETPLRERETGRDLCRRKSPPAGPASTPKHLQPGQAAGWVRRAETTSQDGVALPRGCPPYPQYCTMARHKPREEPGVYSFLFLFKKKIIY